MPSIQRGLEIGADDYIWKPYVAGHLLAKLGNAFRKTKAMQGRKPSVGEISYIAEANLFEINGKKILLTKKEFEIARLLYRSKGSCLSREQISGQLSINTDGNSLDVHLHSLRSKFSGTTVKIKNLRGAGFIWV